MSLSGGSGSGSGSGRDRERERENAVASGSGSGGGGGSGSGRGGAARSAAAGVAGGGAGGEQAGSDNGEVPRSVFCPVPYPLAYHCCTAYCTSLKQESDRLMYIPPSSPHLVTHYSPLLYLYLQRLVPVAHPPSPSPISFYLSIITPRHTRHPAYSTLDTRHSIPYTRRGGLPEWCTASSSKSEWSVTPRSERLH